MAIATRRAATASRDCAKHGGGGANWIGCPCVVRTKTSNGLRWPAGTEKNILLWELFESTVVGLLLLTDVLGLLVETQPIYRGESLSMSDASRKYCNFQGEKWWSLQHLQQWRIKPLDLAEKSTS